jgi:hypothetical protein
MKASVEQRALLALDLLLTRNLSMTKATKLALTTPKTFKKYLKQKGIRWIMKRNRFTVVRTPEQKVYEFIDLINEGKSATAAAKELETTVKTMSSQVLPDYPGSTDETFVIAKSGGSWQTDFIKTENYSLVYYGGITGLGGTTIGRGDQMGPSASADEADQEYMDIWWQVDFDNWESSLPPSEAAEFWKPKVMTVLREKLESLMITDPDLAKSFLGNAKVSTHAAGTGRISATGDLDLTRLEQILQRYEVKMMSSVKSGVDDNLMFRQPAYILKSSLCAVTSKGQFQIMFLNKDSAETYPKRPESIDVEHNLEDEQV